MMKLKETNVINQESGDGWSIYNADCVDFASGLPDESIESKSKDHESMKSYMKLATFKDRDKVKTKIDYNPKKTASIPDWLERNAS